MKYIIVIIFLVSVSCLAKGQDTLDLFHCHQSAMEGHPGFTEKSLYSQSRDLKVKNLNAGWYPALDLNGRYTWQNEVVELPFNDLIPGFEAPLMPHYNYKLTVDIQQTLYDGGMTKAGRELEESNLQVQQQQVEVSLNKLKEQVNRVYFHILLLQQQEKSIRMKLNELDQRMAVLESGVKNELFLEADLDVMQAEILRVRQQLAEIEISKSSTVNILERLTYQDIPDETILILPASDAAPSIEVPRPEHILYDLQINRADANKKLISRKRQPTAYVFGQLGYGNPAFNFFRDEFRGFYVVGAGLHWNIWDWSKSSREKQDMTVHQDIIRTRKDAFNEQLSIELEEDLSEINKFREAVQRDEEIVALREKITRSAASRLDNGMITSTDYITELNAETEARIMLEMHKIQLVQAQISYLTSIGII